MNEKDEECLLAKRGRFSESAKNTERFLQPTPPFLQQEAITIIFWLVGVFYWDLIPCDCYIWIFIQPHYYYYYYFSFLKKNISNQSNKDLSSFWSGLIPKKKILSYTISFFHKIFFTFNPRQIIYCLLIPSHKLASFKSIIFVLSNTFLL